MARPLAPVSSSVKWGGQLQHRVTGRCGSITAPKVPGSAAQRPSIRLQASDVWGRVMSPQELGRSDVPGKGQKRFCSYSFYLELILIKTPPVWADFRRTLWCGRCTTGQQGPVSGLTLSPRTCHFPQGLHHKREDSMKQWFPSCVLKNPGTPSCLRILQYSL